MSMYAISYIFIFSAFYENGVLYDKVEKCKSFLVAIN